MKKSNSLPALTGVFICAILVCVAFFGAYLWLQSSNSTIAAHTGGLAAGYTTQCFQDAVHLADASQAEFSKDVKYVYRDGDKARLVDYAHGFVIDLPSATEFNFSRSTFGSIAAGDGWQLNISRESSPYEDANGYIEHYYHRFILSEEFQQSNAITLHEDTTRQIGDGEFRIISLTRTPYEGSEIKLNSYTYAYIFDPNRPLEFIRLMLKTEAYDPDLIDQILSTVQVITPTGQPSYRIDTKPQLPNWNQETADFYQSLSSREDIMWGVYTHKLVDPSGLSSAVYDLEEKLDYNFPLVMGYTYLNDHPPIQAMQQAYDDGKITELTLQISTNDNAGLDSLANPNFQVLDGQKDDMLRSFARDLKEFAHPVLFRLNNEMNTDWTSYSGVVTLADPDIYREVHSRIFRIFQEEGVDNVIWIFNPQYGNYPPANWNQFMNYYPGSDQIQVLGVTAYNTGDYYYEQTMEQWHSFDELYSAAESLYLKDFDHMPWIITEFSCSSHGGNKANWIRNMFADISKYKNIKAAVWFNFADYDPNNPGVIARPYFLDETPETTQAFKDGLHGIITTERLPETP